MSAFCIPTPCIVPLRIPVVGESRCVDVDTKIDILCETELQGVEVYYTIDGTKPQPYAGIVQGSRTLKFQKPFTLPPGKITIKALAIHSVHHTICSNVITKTFYVRGVQKKPKTKKPKIFRHEVKTELPVDESAGSFVIQEPDTTCNEAEVHPDEEDKGDVSSKSGSDTDEDRLDYENSIIEDSEEMRNLSSPKTDISQRVVETVSVGTEPDAPSIVEENDNLESATAVPEAEVTCTETQQQHPLPQSDTPVQYCSTCSKVNSLLAHYCDSCGQKLHKVCRLCREWNPIVSNYCQFCGSKFDQEEFLEASSHQKPQVQAKNKGVLVKPVATSRGTTCMPKCSSQSIQTDSLDEKVCRILRRPSNQVKHPKKVSKGVQTPDLFDTSKRKSPTSSPGRGYWRMQLDYICNHLKAHTNNNIDFRKSIGSPPLGRFLSADVTNDEESLSINIQFEILPDTRKLSSD